MLLAGRSVGYIEASKKIRNNMAFAVFFGFVFFGLIYLYIKTRDTWNWKKIALWFGGSTLVLIAISLAAIFSDSIKELAPTIPRTITSYDNIKLGDKLSDVEFKKGKLTKIATKKTGDDVYEINSKTSIYVDKNTQLVSGLYAGCADYQSTKFNGIGCDDSGEKIQDKFKGEVSVLCRPEEKGEENLPVRAYDVAKYGVRYILEKNAVIGIFVFPIEFWTNNKTKWVACK